MITDVTSGARYIVYSNSKYIYISHSSELTPEDHGEYICRLYDFDRNVLAQQSVPIIVFGKIFIVTEM